TNQMNTASVKQSFVLVFFFFVWQPVLFCAEAPIRNTKLRSTKEPLAPMLTTYCACYRVFDQCDGTAQWQYNSQQNRAESKRIAAHRSRVSFPCFSALQH